MEDLLDFFTDIQDPRSNCNQKHPLKTLIGTTLLASPSGIDSFSGFSDFRKPVALENQLHWRLDAVFNEHGEDGGCIS